MSVFLAPLMRQPRKTVSSQLEPSERVLPLRLLRRCDLQAQRWVGPVEVGGAGRRYVQRLPLAPGSNGTSRQGPRIFSCLNP